MLRPWGFQLNETDKVRLIFPWSEVCQYISDVIEYISFPQVSDASQRRFCEETVAFYSFTCLEKH